MNRTYTLKHRANKGKRMKVIKTVRAYRYTAALIARDQWRCFYESVRPFNKQCDIKHIGTQLSERFKQTCQYQVVGTLDSFISNRQNDFVYHIHRSAFNEDTKHRMFTVNKYELWYNKYLFSVMFVTRKEKKVAVQGQRVHIYSQARAYNRAGGFKTLTQDTQSYPVKASQTFVPAGEYEP